MNLHERAAEIAALAAAATPGPWSNGTNPKLGCSVYLMRHDSGLSHDKRIAEGGTRKWDEGYADFQFMSKAPDMAALIAEMEARLRELEAGDRRLKAMLPLFEEARDALPAITEHSRKLRGISLTLADRMDDVGIYDRWKAIDAARKEQTT